MSKEDILAFIREVGRDFRTGKQAVDDSLDVRIDAYQKAHSLAAMDFLRVMRHHETDPDVQQYLAACTATTGRRVARHAQREAEKEARIRAATPKPGDALVIINPSVLTRFVPLGWSRRPLRCRELLEVVGWREAGNNHSGQLDVETQNGDRFTAGYVQVPLNPNWFAHGTVAEVFGHLEARDEQE